MSEQKPREFWIRDQHLNYGTDIQGAKFVAFETPDIEGAGIIHVHEVDPAREKAIEKLVEALIPADCFCKWKRGIMTNERYYECKRCLALSEWERVNK